mgnify:FL=1|jgi:hypothetical protein|tara:strand:- start:232 stop:687 length:456 start_codon:yes stop_codon:yes gene_type:complete
MSTKLEILRKFIREIIKQELKEASVTGNIDGGEGPPKTPAAFRKKKSKRIKKAGHEDGHKDPAISGYSKVNEGKYHEYRNDDTMTPKQKIGRSMREVRDGLNSLEQLVKMNVKLKNELNVNSQSYWKNTHKALHKISERLVKLANKVGQLQ